MQHEFKTHSFSFIQQGEWVVFDFTLNSDIYFEMQLSSRACEFGNSIKEQNNRALINMFSMFGVQPNLEYLFKPTPIENERYLIYRFIKSILQDDNPRLVQFESENEYRYFCDSHNITAEQQIWFKRIYVNDNINSALSYVLQKSLIFQELYFPPMSNKVVPSHHEVQSCHKNYSFKSDFIDIYDVIRRKEIKSLYHFTDSRNIQSIKETGYIYSQNNIRRIGINTVYASTNDSRDIDSLKGLSNFVRLSFVPSHPMMHVAMTCGRIRHPRVIEINPLILLLPGVLISDRNAIKTGAKIGSHAYDLERCHFELFSKNYLSLNDIDSKMYFQAEILVPDKIGNDMIINTSDIF